MFKRLLLFVAVLPLAFVSAGLQAFQTQPPTSNLLNYNMGLAGTIPKMDSYSNGIPVITGSKLVDNGTTLSYNGNPIAGATGIPVPLTLNGGSASTVLTVNGTSNGVLPSLFQINDATTAASVNYSMSDFATGLPVGGTVDWILGKTNSSGNALVLAWNNTALTTTNNWCIATWGMAANCNLRGFVSGAVQSRLNTLDDGSGNAGFVGNVSVQGQLSSTINTNPASITNSGVSLSANPNVGDVVYYDQTQSTNNHIVEAIWLSGAYQVRFKNDAQNTALTAFSIAGGQAGGVTGIASNSGSGTWTHTGNMNIVGALTTNSVPVKPVYSGSGTTTTAATLPVAVPGVTASMACWFAPTNAIAVTDGGTNGPFITPSTGTITLTWAAGTTAGGIFNVFCQ